MKKRKYTKTGDTFFSDIKYRARGDYRKDSNNTVSGHISNVIDNIKKNPDCIKDYVRFIDELYSSGNYSRWKKHLPFVDGYNNLAYKLSLEKDLIHDLYDGLTARQNADWKDIERKFNGLNDTIRIFKDTQDLENPENVKILEGMIAESKKLYKKIGYKNERYEDEQEIFRKQERGNIITDRDGSAITDEREEDFEQELKDFKEQETHKKRSRKEIYKGWEY